jgi:hypothetical protein
LPIHGHTSSAARGVPVDGRIDDAGPVSAQQLAPEALVITSTPVIATPTLAKGEIARTELAKQHTGQVRIAGQWADEVGEACLRRPHSEGMPDDDKEALFVSLRLPLRNQLSNFRSVSV